MRLDYTLRPSIIRANARFRGPTESDKYFNYVQEVLHDITLLGRVMDQDEVNKTKGHTNFISDNLAVYFSGNATDIRSNVGTATTLIEKLGATLPTIDFNGADWVAHGGCVKTATTLESLGTADPCGISYNLDVQEGQIIYMRMFVKLVSGSADYFSLGSSNVNQGEGSSSTFKIPAQGRYVGHYIKCRHKESIVLDIDVNRLAQTTYAGKIEILDTSIDYIAMADYHLQPLNTTVKSKINVLEQEIRNIIDNM